MKMGKGAEPKAGDILTDAAESPAAVSILDAPPGVYHLPELGVVFVKPIDDEGDMIEGMSVDVGEQGLAGAWTEHDIDRPYRAVPVDLAPPGAKAPAPEVAASPVESADLLGRIWAALSGVEGLVSGQPFAERVQALTNEARELAGALAAARDRAEEERASDDVRRYELVRQLVGAGETSDRSMTAADKVVTWLAERRGGRR